MRKVSMVAMTLMTVLLVMALTGPAMAEDMAKVNINTATREQIMTLKGVGASYADRIIEYRDKNGPFQSPEDLLKVKGIGEKTLEVNQARIVVKESKQK